MSSLKLFLHLHMRPQCKYKGQYCKHTSVGNKLWCCHVTQTVKISRWVMQRFSQWVCSHSMTHNWYQQRTEHFNCVNTHLWFLYFWVMWLLNHLVSSHLSLGLPSGFCTIILYLFLLYPLLTTCPQPFGSFSFDYLTNTLWAVQTMQFPIIQFPLLSCYFFPPSMPHK